MKYILIPAFFVCAFLHCNTAGVLAADEDIFGDYARDMRKEADAKSTNVYNAWADNMANMIETGTLDGVVVDGAGSYAGGKIKSDGLGNVNIDRYANVGPVINKTTIRNSNVILKNNRW